MNIYLVIVPLDYQGHYFLEIRGAYTTIHAAMEAGKELSSRYEQVDIRVFPADIAHGGVLIWQSIDGKVEELSNVA